jgi:hypothetical protein
MLTIEFIRHDLSREEYVLVGKLFMQLHCSFLSRGRVKRASDHMHARSHEMFASTILFVYK